jgi:hypothetical protein
MEIKYWGSKYTQGLFARTSDSPPSKPILWRPGRRPYPYLALTVTWQQQRIYIELAINNVKDPAMLVGTNPIAAVFEQGQQTIWHVFWWHLFVHLHSLDIPFTHFTDVIQLFLRIWHHLIRLSSFFGEWNRHTLFTFFKRWYFTIRTCTCMQQIFKYNLAK